MLGRGLGQFRSHQTQRRVSKTTNTFYADIRMRNGPQVLVQNGCIPHFQPRKTLLSLANALFLLFRCPSLPGNVYIPTFLSRSNAPALLCFASLVQIVLG